MPVCQLLSVIRRGDTFLLFENAAEIERVVVADDRGNLCHIVVGAFKQMDSVARCGWKECTASEIWW